MRIKHFILIVWALSLYSLTGFAQSAHKAILDDEEGSCMYLISDLLPKGHITLITGEYSIGLYSSGPTYKDLVKNETSTLIEIDANNVYAKLKDKNLLSFENEIKTLGVGIRFGRLGLGFQHSIVAYNYLSYTKELFGTLFLGNAQYIGQNVQISPNLNTALYNSFGFGGAYDLGKTKIAARVNLLTGIIGANTFKSGLNLFTDPEYYQLKLTTDYEVGTSGILNLDSLKSQNFLSLTNKYQLTDLFTSNYGLNVDFALHTQLNDKISLGASISRLGYINFNKNANIYTSSKQINYDGLDLSKYVTKDSVAIEGLLDSFSNLVKFDKRASSFKLKLAPEIQVYAKYFFNSKLSFYGGVFYSALSNGSIISGSAGVNFKPISLLSLGSNLTYLPGTKFNLGLHGKLNLGKLSIQAGTDNILFLINAKNANFTTGYAGLRWHF